MTRPQRIAVAVIHGVGHQDGCFADRLIGRVRRRFSTLVADAGVQPAEALVMEPVVWAAVLESAEDDLWQRVSCERRLAYAALRRFMVGFAADAVAYQPVPGERAAYDRIHAELAAALKRLAAKAGPDAPLCVIAHSLGTVIASNFLYDLQQDASRNLISDSVRGTMGDTPLERGETFASFYTLGSPIALWSLRYPNGGVPVAVPSPQLAHHCPALAAAGEWINFYDPDDVIAYPLKRLNAAYGTVVTEDRAVNVGSWLTCWNPFSHEGYWTDRAVTDAIAAGLVGLWRGASGEPDA